jgi:hypothetical protein
MQPDRWCEGPGCLASIAFLRPQAKYCSAACRKAAHLDRKRSALGDRTVSLADGDQYFDALDAVRGYVDDWKPQRKTHIMIGQIKDILEEYPEHLPLTCRQVYYRMIAKYRHPKGDSFRDSLYRVLNLARRSQMIEFEDIRDDGILGGGWRWFDNPQEMVDSWAQQADGFSRDVQSGQPVSIQVWCEAAGMVPQLERFCYGYSVQVYSNGGFNSLPAVRRIVDGAIDTDKPTLLLHLGDCDPSGVSIFQALVEDAAAFLERDRYYDTQRLQYERVAITRVQIAEYSLPMDKIETGDSRSRIWRDRGLTHKVEIEATGSGPDCHLPPAGDRAPSRFGNASAHSRRGGGATHVTPRGSPSGGRLYERRSADRVERLANEPTRQEIDCGSPTPAPAERRGVSQRAVAIS